MSWRAQYIVDNLILEDSYNFPVDNATFVDKWPGAFCSYLFNSIGPLLLFYYFLFWLMTESLHSLNQCTNSQNNKDLFGQLRDFK